MSLAAALSVLGISASSCGSSSGAPHANRSLTGEAIAEAATIPAPVSRVQPSAAKPTHPQALVTDETENRLLVVDLRSGRVVRRITMAADPENVAVGDAIVVVSSRSGRITLLDHHSLRVLRVLGGFQSPHIPAISPHGDFAYVTDDARGTLSAISLHSLSITSTVAVGPGAHHVAFSPDGRQAWIALGESAGTIALVDCADPARPRVTGDFKPGFAVHDLAFSPDGAQVWVSSATGPEVSAFSARGGRPLFRIAVGAPPQHVAFSGRYAFLTSGYGARIEKALVSSGAVLAHAAAPYGSFELDASHGIVASSSLLRGTLAVYDLNLRLLRVLSLAPAARDLAISAF
ncbi:MAG TPA: YncE family protein [Solirubrobacteraceae bacterium]